MCLHNCPILSVLVCFAMLSASQRVIVDCAILIVKKLTPAQFGCIIVRYCLVRCALQCCQPVNECSANWLVRKLDTGQQRMHCHRKWKNNWNWSYIYDIKWNSRCLPDAKDFFAIKIRRMLVSLTSNNFATIKKRKCLHCSTSSCGWWVWKLNVKNWGNRNPVTIIGLKFWCSLCPTISKRSVDVFEIALDYLYPLNSQSW